MALPIIDPLETEFDMPNPRREGRGGRAVDENVKKEIIKLGQAITDKTKSGLETATKMVISNVPKMIADLTKEIESGPVNNFANAMNKLISLTEKLGINLYQYNAELAETVDEFVGTQEKINQKILEYRENGIKAEYDQKSGAIKFITAQEVKIRKELIEKNEKLITEKQSEISTLTPKLGTNQFVKKTKTGDSKVVKSQEAQEKYLKAISDEITKLNEENAKAKESIKDDSLTAGRDDAGFSKLAELKEAFMVIPDTITEVFDTFKAVGTKVFSGFTKLFDEPGKALKEMGKNLTAVGGVFKTARILLALKIAAVVAAIQFFAERIDKIGDFFVGIWDKITGFFQGIVDWFKNSTFGKLLGLGKGDDEKAKPAAAGTAGDMAGETYMEDDNFFKTPVRSPSSATIEDGLENQTITEMGDYNDDSQKFLNQRQMADMDGLGTEEIDYSGIRGGTSLSQLGIKKRQVVGNQLQTDDGMGMYGNVSESLKELNAQNTAESAKVINIQNNSNVNSQSSSGTTVSGFVDHEPDTSFKYVRQSATGSMEF
jgi:hypothetical protein